jgi:phosphoenolpyruvate carboxykinase (ATP)
MALVCGTPVAGEVKNPVTTFLTYALPETRTLPMHSSINTDPRGDNPALFLGLSGTGKTTLGLTLPRALVGDDFQGWNSRGVFTFEAGTYGSARRLLDPKAPFLVRLTADPSVVPVLQGVAWDVDRQVVKLEETSAEASCSLPIAALMGSLSYTGCTAYPTNVFLLVADSEGVLPPLCALTPEQAAYHFLIGYTSKMPGTEVGVRLPRPTFSPCYAGPYLLRDPCLYARLFLSLVHECQPATWLVNTGWQREANGALVRVPLALTRELVRRVLDGALTVDACARRSVFGYRTPPPSADWPTEFVQLQDPLVNLESNRDSAQRLAGLMKMEFAKYDRTETAVFADGAPQAQM